MENLFHILFLIIGLYDIVAAVNLFHLPVDFAQVFLLCNEKFLGLFYHKPYQSRGYGENDYGNQGHQGTDAQHHDKHAHHGGQGGDQLGYALVKALSQRIHIIGDAGQHLAHGPAFKIFHGHPVNFGTDFLPETVGQPLGYAGHDQPLYKGKDRAQHIQPQKEQQDLTDFFKINASGAGNLGNKSVEQLRCGLT